MPKNSLNALIVFDLDDTLVQTGALHYQIISQYIIDRHPEPLTLEQAHILCTTGYYGKWGCTAKYLIAEHEYPANTVEKLYQHTSREAIQQIPQNFTPCMRKKALLAGLQAQGYTLAVLTQSKLSYATALLNHKELLPYFKVVMGRECVNNHSKQRTEPYEMLLSRFHEHDMAPERMLMVEDSPKNLPSAKWLGFSTVLVGDMPHDNEADFYETDILSVLEKLTTQEITF